MSLAMRVIYREKKPYHLPVCTDLVEYPHYCIVTGSVSTSRLRLDLTTPTVYNRRCSKTNFNWAKNLYRSALSFFFSRVDVAFSSRLYEPNRLSANGG